MSDRGLWKTLSILPALLLLVGGVPRGLASPNRIFAPYQDAIEKELPEDLLMRLPSEVPSTLIEKISQKPNRIRTHSALARASFTVSLFSCDRAVEDCLVGSFSASAPTDGPARNALQQHQKAAALITLAAGVRGYFLEGSRQNPPSPLSSVMWEQDGLIYTARFLAEERQNLLYMASSMARSQPLRSSAIADNLSEPPPVPASPFVQSPNPNERFLQPRPLPQRPTSEPEPILAPPAAQPLESTTSPEEPPTPQPIRIFVRQIEVTGSTVFDEDDFAPLVRPYQGRELTLAELRDVADAIAQLYLDRGYINSRARPVSQTLQDGAVELRVTEGRLVEIQIEGTERLNPSYIRDRLQLGISTPLNTAKLEDQLRLLRVDPLLSRVEATLQPTGELGETLLQVAVAEADSFSSQVSVDNSSPPSLGSERLGANLRYRNLTGIGDEISGSYYHSTAGGADVLDISYRAPLNPTNGILQLRVAPYWNRIVQPPFEALGIRGRRELYELSYRQPLLRTPRQEFALSAGFTYQRGQTFVFDQPTPFGTGPDAEGVSRTSVFKFGQDYVSRDSGGSWSVRSQFSVGTGLFDATSNSGSIPDGQFFSWLGQAQRVQRLGDDHLLIIRADVQLTPDSLLPSEQFVIGGGQSVRGFRQNARSGDNGLRFSIEDRITLLRDEGGAPFIQIAPFLDLGAVWNALGNPNQLPNQRFLAGAGLGLLWDGFLGIEGLSARFDYGVPFIRLRDRGGNAQDLGFYFNINYQLKNTHSKNPTKDSQ